MKSWQTTRNTYEAAALCSLDIEPRPVTILDHKTGQEYTDWNLKPASTEDPTRNTKPFITGELRRDFNNGKPINELATTPLHPYLIALRAMHNRARLIEAQKGQAMRLKEEAPGSFILERGSDSTTPAGPYIDTADMDLALCLIGIGCDLVGITNTGSAHVYRVTRYARRSSVLPSEAPAIDGGELMRALRDDLLFPARRWEHFAIQSHALHCLRELRRHQHADRYIAVRHKTYKVRGAAFRENSNSESLAHVQKTLGIKI